MNSTFDARFQMKRDTQEAWEKNDPVLLNGELILVDLPDGSFRVKVGDGSSRYKALPFRAEGGSSHVEVTLLASGWAAGQQVLTIPGVTPQSNGVAGVAQKISDAQMETARLAGIYVSGQGDGTITVTAKGQVPAQDIPVLCILFKE